jgi:hypothetical protein
VFDGVLVFGGGVLEVEDGGVLFFGGEFGLL